MHTHTARSTAAQPSRRLGAGPQKTGLVAALMAVTATLLMALGPASPAAAEIGPGDDRLMTTPTWWHTYYDQTADDVDALGAWGARITDLRVTSASPLRFTVATVWNTGAYNSGWSWYPALTDKEIGDRVNKDQGRLISASRYETSDGPRYAVVMVNNTGSNYKTWYWCDCTATEIGDLVNKTNSRLTYLSSYGTGASQRYVAIAVANEGSDAYSWGWLVGVTNAEIAKSLQPGDQLVDLDTNEDGTYNAIVYHIPGAETWKWQVGSTPTYLEATARQHGLRLISVSEHNGKYAGVMVNNLDGLSAQLRDSYEGKITTGTYGFLLEREDGRVLAELQAGLVHEPASVIKVLFHLHALRKRQKGLSDETTVEYRWKQTPAMPGDDEGCPSTFPNRAATDILTLDKAMMIQSDNRATVAVTDYFDGPAEILATTGDLLGLDNTSLKHCGTIGDRQTTLRDLGKMWMAAADSSTVLNYVHQSLFHDRMINENNFNGPPVCMSGIVAEEAAKLGKSAVVGEFCNAIRFMNKGGAMQAGSKVVWAIGTLTGLPEKGNYGAITHAYYHYGTFVDGMTGGDAEIQIASNVGWGNYQEAMREGVHDALLTW